MTKNMIKIVRGVRMAMVCMVLAGVVGVVPGGQPVAHANGASGDISLTLRDVDIAEVMEMLSRKERVNILLSEGVSGEVSVNLYDVSVEHAIETIATAAGFAVEPRNGAYFIINKDDVGQYADAGVTQIRTFKIQYTKPELVESIIKKHVSRFGKVTILEDRKLLVVEDKPEFLRKIDNLLVQLDVRPKQILIEAKILEVTLRDSESFGLDWSKLFEHDDGAGAFGVRGLSDPGSPGLFFQLLTPNVEVFLDNLETSGRLRTLSTPKLLAMEDQEAETVIGDRLGYKVTTTINQVTTESIEFLESGVILKVTPTVDRQGRIMLDIHPEVSNGSVSDDGIPSQTTTEVTTQMLVRDGQTVFIGGLMKRSTEKTKEGMPLLGNAPLIGRLFSNRAERTTDTETIVLITPYIIGDRDQMFSADAQTRSKRKSDMLEYQALRTEKILHKSEMRQQRALAPKPVKKITPVDRKPTSYPDAIDLWSDEDIL